MALPLTDVAQLKAFVQSSPITLVYFGAPDCAVCTVLKPKLFEMLAARFPQVAGAEVDCAQARPLAAEYGVFAIPSVVAFIEGGESFRLARAFGLAELAAQLERPYTLLYGV